MDRSANSVICEVVIPVYNALSQTARCIESILADQSVAFRLVLVNDSSDKETTNYLREVAAKHRSNIVLLENENNLGFLGTANRGLSYHLQVDEQSLPEFKVILNSDTVVTPGWLSSFKRCFDSDHKIGLATPVSNNAENLSVEMPEGSNVFSLAETVRSIIAPNYPDITTAIGFCMGIRTTVLKEVGVFDPIFSPGYAEDSDYHYKVVCNGYRSVLLEDCFIYHEADASFSTSKMELVHRNRPVFDRRWKVIYTNELDHHQSIAPLGAVNAQINSFDKSTLFDVVFVLPTAKLYGGVIVVYEVVNRLIMNGINAAVVVTTDRDEIKMPLLFSPFFMPTSRLASEKLPRAKLYVATHYETTPVCFRGYEQNPEAKLAYLIQGYEGWFPNAKIKDVVATYQAIPNRIVVSGWLQDMLKRWDISTQVISNGVDSKFFVPRDNYLSPSADESEKNIRLLFLAREDPQGSWDFALRLMERVRELGTIDIVTVGPASIVPQVVALSNEAHGLIDRRAMAKVLRSCDVFVDCSMVQGFGLIGLEAMASGVATVLTNTGGVKQYANESNSLLCSPGDEDALFNAILSLVKNRERLLQLKKEGRTTAVRLDWDNITSEYISFVNQVINSGAALSASNILSMNKFLINRDDEKTRISQSVFLAKTYLAEELVDSSAPRGAYEVVAGACLSKVLIDLQTSAEGSALVAVYEQARSAISRAQNRTAVLREIFTSEDTRGMPLLEKTIQLMQKIS